MKKLITIFSYRWVSSPIGKNYDRWSSARFYATGYDEFNVIKHISDEDR